MNVDRESGVKVAGIAKVRENTKEEDAQNLNT